MDLDKFFASDEEAAASDSEEDETEEEIETQAKPKPQNVATTVASHPVSVASREPTTTGGDEASHSTHEADDEYTDEDSDEEDAFLRRG